MKKVFTIFLILCLYLVQSQTIFNAAYQDYNDYSSSLISHNGNFYFITSSIEPQWKTKVNIRGYNALGQLVLDKPVISSGSFPFINQLSPSMDGNIIVVGYNRACDYSDTSSRYFIQKIDASGTMMFNLKLNRITSFQGMIQVTQMSDSSYFIAADTMVYHVSQKGQLLSKKDLKIGTISAITSVDNKWLIASSVGNGIGTHHWFDTSLTLSSQNAVVTTSSAKKYLKSSTGRLFALLP